MFRNLIIIVLGICCMAGADTADISDANTAVGEKTFPLREGFPIKGIEGTVSYDEQADMWNFELFEDLSDGFGIIKAGQKIQLLESSMLEKIIDIHDNNDVNDFRIWASTVTYRRDNGFFPIYFLPLTKLQSNKIEPDQKSKPQKTVDSNDSILPEDVLEKLEPVRAVTTSQVSQALSNEQDAVLIRRSGFIFYDSITGNYIFRLDSLGRKINNTVFILHKSRTLEFLRRYQRTSPSPMRFEISGRITKFKGKRYLLMHKALPSENYGNLGR